jgi:hypothetical protein
MITNNVGLGSPNVPYLSPRDLGLHSVEHKHIWFNLLRRIYQPSNSRSVARRRYDVRDRLNTPSPGRHNIRADRWPSVRFCMAYPALIPTSSISCSHAVTPTHTTFNTKGKRQIDKIDAFPILHCHTYIHTNIHTYMPQNKSQSHAYLSPSASSRGLASIVGNPLANVCMFVVITYPPYKRNVANSLHKKKNT